MRKVVLTIAKGNKTESIALQQGKTVIKKAEGAVRYRITDENGVLIEHVQVEQIGDDLVFYTPSTEEPLLILEKYNTYYSGENIASVVENSVSITRNIIANSLSVAQLTSISLGAATTAVVATSIYNHAKASTVPHVEQETNPVEPETQPTKPET
ncbi:hypothetical protein AM305_10086, partial [Actinobacillus minor NM305]